MSIRDDYRDRLIEDVRRQMARREAEQRSQHRQFMRAVAVLAALLALLLIVGYRGGLL
jgi:hypothetical protein